MGDPGAGRAVIPEGACYFEQRQSLRTLGVGVIDCLQLHTYWPTWGMRGHWLDELQELERRGKVRTIGVSVPNHRSDMVLPLVVSGEIDAVQTVLNIFDSTALEVRVPFCQAHGVAVLARCIFDEGGLTVFLRDDTVFPLGDFRNGYVDATVPCSAYIAKVQALRRPVPEHGRAERGPPSRPLTSEAGLTKGDTEVEWLVSRRRLSNVSCAASSRAMATAGEGCSRRQIVSVTLRRWLGRSGSWPRARASASAKP